LFNERGSVAVTTNHVADRAGISPGNLYYWFGDKNEIVRELYGQFVAAYEELWGAGHSNSGDENCSDGNDAGGHVGNLETHDPDTPLDLTPDEVLARLACGVALSRQYAFLSRDLLGLLHRDRVLADEYRAVRLRRIAEFTELAVGWRARGLIQPVDDGTVGDLVQALWVVAETWLAFAELDGSHPNAVQGTRLLRVVLRPYLTSQGDGVASLAGGEPRHRAERGPSAT
jgi:AcrR family transcriptional regulator